MDSPNPILAYATPANKLGPLPPQRSGPYLVIQRESILPRRCVFCNQPAHGRPIFIAIHTPLSVSIELPEYELNGKAFSIGTAKLQVSFCSRHASIRSRAKNIGVTFISAALFLMAITTFVAEQNKTEHWIAILLFATLICFPVGVVAFLIAKMGPRFSHRRGGYIYVTGLGPEFLESLPEFSPANASGPWSEDNCTK